MNTACLILHGFCGSPFEVEPLAAPLKELGYHVVMPTLPGHGTTIDELKKTFYDDWVEFAEKELLTLKKLFQHVFVIGFSMGGSLTLELAVRHPLTGFVTISAPCRTFRLFPFEARTLKALFLGILQYTHPYPSMRIAKPESRIIAPFKGYEGVFCTPQLYSMQKGYTKLRKKLPLITSPALIMHDLHDRIVFASNALEIAKSIRSEEIRLIYTSCKERVTSHHHLPTHQETSLFIQKNVIQFVTSVCPNLC